MIKYVTVPKNGQISIGKKYAGRTFAVEEGVNGITLVPGTFVPDHQETFFTAEAKQRLEEFNQHMKDNPLSDGDTDNSLGVLESIIQDKDNG